MICDPEARADSHFSPAEFISVRGVKPQQTIK